MFFRKLYINLSCVFIRSFAVILDFYFIRFLNENVNF